MSLGQSYRYCAAVARQEARNFYYSFLVLPREKRRAFCAVYAFLRHSDDIPDAPDQQQDCAARRKLLHAWRQRLEQALEGDYGDSPLLPAFHDTVRRFAVPHSYFFELIDGAEMDLNGAHFRSFPDLYRYCYRVAGVVGLICLHIFGFPEVQREEACRRAEACGIAFQLTNILRDLREDAGRERIYLPEEDLERFGYTSEQLHSGHPAAGYYGLVGFEAERARSYYREAVPLLHLISPDCRPALWAMIALYSGILRRMETSGFPMLRRRVELTDIEKFRILARAWWLRLKNGGSEQFRGLPLE
jgi:phytoene synthase